MPAIFRPSVGGADAQPESLDAVNAGTQLDTVTHAPYVEAPSAVEAMENELNGGVRPPADRFKNGAGKTVLLVSHRLEGLLTLAERIAVFFHGTIRTVMPNQGLAVADFVHAMF